MASAVSDSSDLSKLLMRSGVPPDLHLGNRLTVQTFSEVQILVSSFRRTSTSSEQSQVLNG